MILGALLLVGGAGALWALRTGRAAKIVEGQIVEQLRAACGLNARFERLEIEPLRAQVRISGLELSSAESGPILSVDRAAADLRFLPLLRGRFELFEVELERPQAQLRIRDGQLVDLPACLSRTSTAPSPAPDSSPVPLDLEALAVRQATLRVRVDDRYQLVLDGLSMALWPKDSGGTAFDLKLDGGTVSVDDRTLTVKTALLGHIEGPVTGPRSIRLSRLQLFVGSLTLDAEGRVDLLGPVYSGALRLRADLSPLLSLWSELPEIEGALDVELSAKGTGLSPDVEAKVQIVDGRVGKRTLGEKVGLVLRANRQGVDIESVSVELGPGDIRAKGRIDFDDALSFRGEAKLRDTSFARFMDALGEKGVWVDFLTSGTSRLKGSLRPPSIEGPFDFSVAGVDVWEGSWSNPAVTSNPSARILDVVPVDIRGRWRFTDSLLIISGASLEAERSRAEVSARIQHKYPGSLELSADISQIDLRDLGDLGRSGLKGVGSVRGELKGRFERLSADTRISMEGLEVAGVPLGGADGRLRWSGHNEILIDEIQGRLSTVGWTGEVGILFEGDIPVRARGQIQQGRLGDLLIPLGFESSATSKLRGKVRGSFDFDGPVTKWNGPVRLKATHISAFGQRLGRGRAIGRLRNGRVEVKCLELRRGQASRTKRKRRRRSCFLRARGRGEAALAASGFLDPARRHFKLDLESYGLRLRHIDPLVTRVPELDGALEASVRLEGALLAPSGRLIARLADLRAGEGPLEGDGQLELRFAPKGLVPLVQGGEKAKPDPERPSTIQLPVVDVELGLPGLGAELRGRVGLGASLPYAADLDLDRSSLPNVMGRLLSTPVDGLTSLKARLRGQLLSPVASSSGEIRLGLLKAKIRDASYAVDTPLKLPLDRGKLSIAGLRARGEDLRLEVNGAIEPGRTDLSAKGQLDLRSLAAWIPPIARSAGRFDFDGRLLRGAGGLDVVGEGRIVDGVLEWRDVPNRFTGIRGDLTFSQASVLVESLEARWAGGRVGVAGSLLFEDRRPGPTDFRITVERVRPRLPMDWVDLHGRLDGAVNLSGAWPKLEARGRLEVREARATPRTDISDMVGRRRLAVAYDPSAEVLAMDLGIELRDPLRVRNDDLDLALSGDLRLTGTNERPGLLGTLALARGGRVSFVGREYTTEAGIFELRDRFRVDARYDLIVSTTACDARIDVNLVGDFDSVQTTYSSNPEMDREDIASCIVRGIRRRDLDQDLASFAGSALLKLSGMDRQVKRVIPVDQIDVTTEFSPRARQFEPRVLVAKDLSLFNSPVRLEYSTSLLRNDDQRAAFKVRLTPRLSLQLGWAASEDVPTGDWGLDLKRRWEW